MNNVMNGQYALNLVDIFFNSMIQVLCKSLLHCAIIFKNCQNCQNLVIKVPK